MLRYDLDEVISVLTSDACCAAAAQVMQPATQPVMHPVMQTVAAVTMVDACTGTNSCVDCVGCVECLAIPVVQSVGVQTADMMVDVAVAEAMVAEAIKVPAVKMADAAVATEFSTV